MATWSDPYLLLRRKHRCPQQATPGHQWVPLLVNVLVGAFKHKHLPLRIQGTGIGLFSRNLQLPPRYWDSGGCCG
jgi:hypothetical protein